MSDSRKDSPVNMPSIEDWFDGGCDESVDRLLTQEEWSSSEPQKLSEQLLIHSLLIGQLESSTSREQRILATLDAFERQCETSSELTSEPTSEPKTSSAASANRTLGARRRWLLFVTTAATFMLALGVWGLLVPQSAQAALNRVLEATRLPVTRVYDAKIYRQVLGREVQRDAVLYSQSVDLFAAEFQEKGVRPEAWIGFDGDHRWLATEKHQWRSTDAGGLWSDDVFDRMTSRNMHFNAMLTELPKSFDVRLLPVETVSIGDNSFDCQPIEATPRKPSPDYPDVVRIWPHPESGVILQMHLIINDRKPLSVRRIELQFVREQEVPEAFFTLDYHQPK